MLCFTANRLFIPNGLMLFSLELYNWNSEDFNLVGGQDPIKTIIFLHFISLEKFLKYFVLFTSQVFCLHL